MFRGTVRQRRGSGFTLVELLVVIGIIAVLIALLLPGLSKARRSATVIKCAANLHNIGLSLQNYAAANRG
jgi:prepilin-type N-terminal cleavage/methylation domain-containing protein